MQFHKPENFVGEDAMVSLVVSVNSPLPIRFTSIRVFFLPREVSHVFFDHSTAPIPEKPKDPAGTPMDFVDCRNCVWSETVFQKELDLVFYPKRLRVFEIPLKVRKGREIKCSLVAFHLDGEGRHLSFKHNIVDTSPLDVVEHKHTNVGVLRKASGQCHAPPPCLLDSPCSWCVP